MIAKIPKHWKIKKLGEICKVNQGLQIAIEERFTEPIENGYFYITNEFLKANSKTKYYIKNPSKSVLCSKEDILMTRTGNTGIVVSDVEGVFHNNFFKIDYDKKLLHKDYFVYYLKNDRMQYDILVKAGNSTIPDLNHSDFYTLQIAIPPLKEQEKIAEILLSCDKAIRLTTQIINQLKQRNQGLAQQLLTGEKRVKGFENSIWKEVRLGELLAYEQPTNYLVKNTDYSDEYKIPVLTAGKTFILGYTNEKEGICTNIPLILFDDFTTDSRYIDFPFKVKSSAVKLLKAKKNANLRFIFEAMKLIKYAIGGHERHWISKYAFLTIFVPLFKEQNAIAQILDTAHQELKLYEQKLQLLQAQKKTLMQKLLTGEVLTIK
jgi:restriction modification system DNA specificity domain protein